MERPHVYSHANALATRDKLHAILLPLKYRWNKNKEMRLPIERRLFLQSLFWVRWIEPLCVNDVMMWMCATVSQSCPPHSAGLGAATATPVRVWSRELSLLAVLLLQTMHGVVKALDHQVGFMGRVGPMFLAERHIYERGHGGTACPLSSMSLATAMAPLALAMTAQTQRRRAQTWPREVTGVLSQRSLFETSLSPSCSFSLRKKS